MRLGGNRGVLIHFQIHSPNFGASGLDIRVMIVRQGEVAQSFDAEAYFLTLLA